MDLYTTRFGDVVDANTHETVAWHPALVSPGVYGDGTQAWIDAQLRKIPTPTQRPLVLASLLVRA